jgi:hypothetical protein
MTDPSDTTADAWTYGQQAVARGEFRPHYGRAEVARACHATEGMSHE